MFYSAKHHWAEERDAKSRRFVSFLFFFFFLLSSFAVFLTLDCAMPFVRIRYVTNRRKCMLQPRILAGFCETMAEGWVSIKESMAFLSILVCSN